MNKEAFTYCWTDKARNMLYVGTHKGLVNDGYVCSSKVMLEEYNKRPGDFVREILAFGKYYEMIKFETAILRAAKASSDPAFYNMHNGDGNFYNKAHSEETKQKLKIARKQRAVQPMQGKTFTEKSKKKQSEAAKKAALSDGRGKRLAENRGKNVDYSALMKEVWRKRKEGKLDMPNYSGRRGT